MRKKSFWLSLSPWNPPRRRACLGARPPARKREPRHLCTRRPSSSEAPGKCVRPGTGGRQWTRRPGASPRRRPPLPSVSSSSSFARLLRFPAVVCASFRSGVRFPARVLRTVVPALRSGSRQGNLFRLTCVQVSRFRGPCSFIRHRHAFASLPLGPGRLSASPSPRFRSARAHPESISGAAA